MDDDIILTKIENPALTHDETLRIGQLLKELPEVFIPLLIRGAQDLTEKKRENEIYPCTHKLTQTQEKYKECIRSATLHPTPTYWRKTLKK